MPQDSPPPPPEATPRPAPVPSVARKVATGTAWLIAVRFVSRTLGVVSTLVVARALVPGDFGLVAMATAFSQSVDAFSEVGLREALVRHPTEASDLYDTAFTMQAVRGFLTASVIAAAVPFAGRWFGEPRLAPILLILAALAVASGFENIAIAEFQRTFRFGMEFGLRILPRFLQVATAIVASLLLHSYWALVIAIGVFKLSRLAATYALHPHRSGLTLRHWRELVGFSFWTWAGSIARVAWDRSDAFIIAPALGATAFGIYSLGWEVGSLPVTELLAPAAAVLFSGFAEARRRGDPDSLSPVSAMTLLLFAMMPLALAISSAAGPVVTVVLGAKWHAAAPLVAIAAINCVMAPFSWISVSLLSATGRVARNFVVAALGAAVRIGLLVYAVRTGDLVTASWCSLLSFAFETTAFILVASAAGELRLRQDLGGMLRTFLAGGASAATVWATGWGWHDLASPRSSQGVIAGVGVGLFAIAMFGAFALLLWQVAGRPWGPERRLAHIAIGLCGRLGKMLRGRAPG